MNHLPFSIHYTLQARADMDSLFYYIAYELLVPDTVVYRVVGSMVVVIRVMAGSLIR